ncbi:MAG TPA: class I SAM-dependent methyltransferase [Candidatus Limnocylindrales bacterium]|nr:class I SAM-dependent methyltransferase [Candidatus Limnocylindrales bacterium]
MVYAPGVPFRARFECLWCGRPWTAADGEALEGWAQLCPDCLGRAGDNGFLRARLHAAIAERGRSQRQGPDPDAEMVAYYEARATEYDDWYLRRGRYDHGPLENLAWTMELDQATLWLDRQPLNGRIVELAAGTGWWSPLLAGKGELWCYDAAGAPLDRASQRLVAHRLRAHLHVRDAWAPPEPPPADALFTGFWLSHVRRARLGTFLALARAWLKPGGRLAFIDSRPDPASGAPDQDWDPATETSRRRLADGRTFTVPKVYYAPDELDAALRAAGFEDPEITTTSRFFLLGSAVAGEAGQGNP